MGRPAAQQPPPPAAPSAPRAPLPTFCALMSPLPPLLPPARMATSMLCCCSHGRWKMSRTLLSEIRRLKLSTGLEHLVAAASTSMSPRRPTAPQWPRGGCLSRPAGRSPPSPPVWQVPATQLATSATSSTAAAAAAASAAASSTSPSSSSRPPHSPAQVIWRHRAGRAAAGGGAAGVARCAEVAQLPHARVRRVDEYFRARKCRPLVVRACAHVSARPGRFGLGGVHRRRSSRRWAVL